ncbi:NAD-dependent epimerase/dehydratase family protein [bacterium]|nr:NAD-dependent epimerase/dehydratase family protein [bacterium]
MRKKGYTEQLRDKDILITGGLGFIGSNLAIRLVNLGARVTLLDAMIEDHGGNLFNIEPVKEKVRVNFSDVRDESSVKYLVRNRDYIFHLAGQNDHVLSLSNPFPDIDINIKGTAILLEACRRYNPGVRLIFSGTRGEYGPSVKLPVSEDAPINPKGIYELSSLTAQKLFKIYHDNHSVRSVTLRLTNIFGERGQMMHSRFGVANWFIRLAIDNETIKVFGDGSLKRDDLQKRLKLKGIHTLIHYPSPIHYQEAYKWLGYNRGDFPESERLSSEILSLPLYPEIDEERISHICSIIRKVEH